MSAQTRTAEGRRLRAANNAEAPAELKKRGIPFKLKPQGRIEITFGHRKFIDFYPGTGNWRIRGSIRAGQGYDDLEQFYKNALEQP